LDGRGAGERVIMNSEDRSHPLPNPSPIQRETLLSETIDHLRVLVGYDTRNPPRTIGREGLFDYLCAQLHGFECELVDHGAGAIRLLATRGKPRLLFNVHLDTVPDSPHWRGNPFELRVERE